MLLREGPLSELAPRRAPRRLTEAEFARAMPRRQRERLIRGELQGGQD